MLRLLGAIIVSALLTLQGAAQTPSSYPLPDGAAPAGLAVDKAGVV